MTSPADRVTPSAVVQHSAAPHVSRNAAVVRVILGLVAAGALLGVVWAIATPPVHGVVALARSGDRVKAYLGNESDNFFLGQFLLVGLVVVVAIVSAVALWQWRAHRGPVLVAALAVGAAAATAVAAGVGALLVHWRYGSIDIAAAPVSRGHRVHYVVEAPSVFFGHSPGQIAATLVFPAALGALTYALIAVSAARDDLGGWPPEPAGNLPPSFSDRVPTGVGEAPSAPSAPSP